MNSNNYSKIIFLILLTASSVRAQTITNEGFLENYAINKHNQYLADSAEVVAFAQSNNIPIRQELPDGTLLEIQHILDGKPFYYMTHNSNAALSTRTDELRPGGSVGSDVTGSGYDKLGEWDGGGVLTTHQEFGSRINQVDTPPSTHYHATHVAGTMVAKGVVASAKGMAYEADLDAYDWTNDESEMATAGAAGMEVSNHSYGFSTGWSSDYWYGDISISTDEDVWFGYYSTYTQEWDQIAFNAPYYLIVKSAGNDRNDDNIGDAWHYHYDGGWVLANDYHGPDGGASGYDCLPTKGNAKNILLVGAVNDVTNYTQPSDVVMTSFSSWGPTDDGRIKPDVVGNGASLYSTDDDADDDYRSLSGTSMSSPNVTGTLALLQQHYQNTHSSSPMYAATLKALAIHTADEAGQTIGPDYMFGWGLVNAEEAGSLVTIDGFGADVIDEQVLSQGGTYSRTIASDGTEPLKVTICWTDPPGTPVSSNYLNNRTPMLVNDLDLEVRNGATYYPWSLDPDNPADAATNSGENDVDNVEQVYIASPSAGQYTIEVSHDGTLNGGSQAFSIIVSGNDFSDCIDGSMIYNTETEKFNFCEDGIWVEK